MADLSQYSTHFFPPDGTNNSWSNMYQFIPPNTRILDVGCSTGNFGAALRELKNCYVVGVDINNDDIEVAATKLDEAYCLDISDPRVVESLGSFDVICCADVIEHLANPREALRSIHGILNKGGIVVYSIPNMAHAAVRLELMGGKFRYAELGLLDRTHMHFYDRSEVEDVFGSASFAIVHERPTVVTYPRQLFGRKLEELGLSVSESFFEMMESTEANVYQFVGVARPSDLDSPADSQKYSFISPPDEILEYANTVNRRNIVLSAELGEVSTELQETRARLSEIRHHPFRVLLGAIRRRIAWK